MTKKDETVYLVVPKKAIITLCVVFVCLAVAIIASFQYSNYVDRRSNNLLCSLVELQDQVYTNEPPPSQTGKDMAVAINKVAHSKECNR